MLALHAQYPTMDAFKHAARDYALQHGFTIRFPQLKSDWALAACADKECSFSVRAIISKKRPDVVQVTVMKGDHVCAGKTQTGRASHNEHGFLVNLVRICIIRFPYISPAPESLPSAICTAGMRHEACRCLRAAVQAGLMLHACCTSSRAAVYNRCCDGHLKGSYISTVVAAYRFARLCRLITRLQTARSRLI